MYEMLKKLLATAEVIFEIHDVRMEENSKYWGNRITIEGVDSENRSYELCLTVKDNETSGEK